ncbi:MAG: hypothetical protein ACI4DN_08015, partial [Lachnospiraceae bacterium]
MEYYKNCGSSELLDDTQKKELKNIFKKLKKKVILIAILEKDTAKSLELARLLNDISSLCSCISTEYIEAGTDSDMEAVLDCDSHFPIFGIFYENRKFSGLSYLGIPGGKEINSLVYGLYN